VIYRGRTPALAAGNPSASQTVSVAGSQPAAKGPAAYSTGNVRVDPLFGAKGPAPFSGAYVTFEPETPPAAPITVPYREVTSMG